VCQQEQLVVGPDDTERSLGVAERVLAALGDEQAVELPVTGRAQEPLPVGEVGRLAVVSQEFQPVAVVVDVETPADVERLHTRYRADVGLKSPASGTARRTSDITRRAPVWSDSYTGAGSQSPPMRRQPWVRTVARVGVFVLALATLAGTALAHGGSLGGAARPPLSVPAWLVAGTAGVALGVSAIVTTRSTSRVVTAARPTLGRHVPVPGQRALVLVANALGVVTLAGVVVVGYLGPADPLSNGAVVVVWAGWWAGFAMSTYLLGDTWPALDPFRTLARPLSALGRTYRWQWGAWPSVAGLLALGWVEVVGPLADRPPVLATVVLAYGVVTVGGAVVYGTDVWFQEVDPVARVFALYGQVAPLRRDDEGSVRFRLPGAGLTEDVLAGADDVAFVVALLWVPTFDGLVTTPLWGRFARGVVGWGVPALVLYPLALATGFAVYWGLYLAATRLARRMTGAEVGVPTLARRFAPGLLALAAGYHFAHVFDFFLSLVPALVLAVIAPFATVDPGILVVPDWFGWVAVGAVLTGHVLAVLGIRTTAFELFPERDQAVRCQYPVAAVMVSFTVVSLWVVTRPEFAPPFLGP